MRRKRNEMKKSCAHRRTTKFEQFSTEIFFEIFEYLKGNHIFKSFFDLNQRFNELVCNAPNVHLDCLRSKTKLYHRFLQVFHSQHIISMSLSYENVNLLQRLHHKNQLKALSLSTVSLRAFEDQIPEILSSYRHQLISLTIHFADMHYSDTGSRAAQSFGYLLTELSLLKHLVLEHPYGIDSITYMPSMIINRSIINLTITLHDDRRLIPLLYRFEQLKTLIIHHSSILRKMALYDNLLLYRSQLHEKTSIDYPVKIQHIKIYDNEMLFEKLERLFQIIISPNLLTLSLFTSRRSFQVDLMGYKQVQSSNNKKQWYSLLKRYLLSTMKQFHIEYENVERTLFLGNLQQVKNDFIKHTEFSSTRKVSCSYEQNEKRFSFDVFLSTQDILPISITK